MAKLTDASVVAGQLLLHYLYMDKDGRSRSDVTYCPIHADAMPIARMLKEIPIRHNGKVSSLRESEFLDMIEKARTLAVDMAKIALLEPQNYVQCTQCAAKVFIDKNSDTGICVHCDAQVVRV